MVKSLYDFSGLRLDNLGGKMVNMCAMATTSIKAIKPMLHCN
jgi:hypothetical protein